jgi:hypothetical protein
MSDRCANHAHTSRATIIVAAVRFSMRNRLGRCQKRRAGYAGTPICADFVKKMKKLVTKRLSPRRIIRRLGIVGARAMWVDSCRGKAMAVRMGIISSLRSTYEQSAFTRFPVVAATVPDGYQCAVTLCGGEDANCVVTGPTTTGANRSIHCSRSSPTVSNCHFLRNLSVGMERGLARGLSRAGSQTRRRHQTHDRQLHLRRQF